MEDSTLIARVKAGDRNAFNELYGLYWASLVNYAGLFVGDDGAEDVVQDVFVRIWLHRDNLRDDGSLQGYLLRSVYHASLNALKKGANATAYRSWVAQQIEQSCYAHYDPDNSEIIRKLYSQEVAGERCSACAISKDFRTVKSANSWASRFRRSRTISIMP